MNKRNLGIYIKPNGFDFKSKDTILSSLSIPNNVLDDMKVLDPLGLEKIIKDAVAANNIDVGNTNIFLSNEVIFNKIVSTADEEKAFYDKIPVEPENLIKQTVVSGEQKIAIAVNKEFVGNIKLVLEKIGFKVSAIVPEAASLQDLIDFGGNSKNSKLPFQKIVLVLLVVIAITAALLFFFIKKPLTKENLISPLPVPSSQATPEATPSLNRNSVKIQILNKTKVAGLAKKVQDALIDFPNTETGNIDGKEIVTTDVTYSPKVGELNNGFDILIETGKAS
jgi:hypothetical protein